MTLLSPVISYREQSSGSFKVSPTDQPATNETVPHTGTGPIIPSIPISCIPARHSMPQCVVEPRLRSSVSDMQTRNKTQSSQTFHVSDMSEHNPVAQVNRSNCDQNFYTQNLASGLDSSRGESNTNVYPYYSTYRLASSGCFRNRQAMKSPCFERHMAQPTSQTHPSSVNYDSLSKTDQQASSQKHATHCGANITEIETYMPHQNFSQIQALTRPSLTKLPQSTRCASQASYPSNSTPLTPETTSSLETQNPKVGLDPSLGENGNPCSMPVFDGNGYGLSPSALDDSFTAWLFNAPHLNDVAPGDSRHSSMSIGHTAFMDDSGNIPHLPYGVDERPLSCQYVQPFSSQHRMAVNSILDTTAPPTILSEEKRKQLLDLIDSRFNDTDHAPVRKQKQDLLGGDRNAAGHVLSLKMMKTYIGSYWYHFHPQMPILHQPTFSPDNTQNLLLIAVITLGASCLDKLYGHEVIDAAAELSNFLAFHLRGEIFNDVDFTPPAKLWVFQTLLLLEIYEKMYSTRLLHERAHIHHVTTLTLMRRGGSLIGRSALHLPLTTIDDKIGLNSNQNQRTSNMSPPEQWWNHWITNEATRRVAFGAFIIDSIHATMFGHSATMVAHEMKLQLPCDETAWSATSSAEVGRIEANLQASGVKPISFFDGLKLTLNQKTVRTNSFGRIALMAGLLSVSWHMNQRDVQVRSLGALKALGGKDIWRGTLTKAFDQWRNDFVLDGGGKDINAPSVLYHSSNRLNEEIAFENRIVLHHLAHMAMHVDIVSCQIFAKATRLLGRTTLQSDYTIAQKRIKDSWAPKASARHATFFALKFLALVLTPEHKNSRGSAEELNTAKESQYSAKDDFLLNRPWVLYFAALTAWSYGYALDGPVRVIPSHSTYEEQLCDMRLFLQRVGGVKSPDELKETRDRNACIGMLCVLKNMFRVCRWELVYEAESLLTNCIEMLKGST